MGSSCQLHLNPILDDFGESYRNMLCDLEFATGLTQGAPAQRYQKNCTSCIVDASLGQKLAP